MLSSKHHYRLGVSWRVLGKCERIDFLTSQKKPFIVCLPHHFSPYPVFPPLCLNLLPTPRIVVSCVCSILLESASHATYRRILCLLLSDYRFPTPRIAVSCVNSSPILVSCYLNFFVLSCAQFGLVRCTRERQLFYYFNNKIINQCQFIILYYIEGLFIYSLKTVPINSISLQFALLFCLPTCFAYIKKTDTTSIAIKCVWNILRRISTFLNWRQHLSVTFCHASKPGSTELIWV